MARLEEIKNNAALVKNATQAGENTAERVGGVLSDIADLLEQISGDLSKKADSQSVSDISTELEKIQATILILKHTSETMQEEVSSISEVANGNKTELEKVSEIATKSSFTSSKNEKAIESLRTDIDAVSSKVDSLEIPRIIQLSQTAYDALESKDSDTTYLITEE